VLVKRPAMRILHPKRVFNRPSPVIYNRLKPDQLAVVANHDGVDTTGLDLPFFNPGSARELEGAHDTLPPVWFLDSRHRFGVLPHNRRE